jgi:hypothetical protein
VGGIASWQAVSKAGAELTSQGLKLIFLSYLLGTLLLLRF